MPIQQHPLPQDISSYRFRLIGDMTLKQFASLAVCIVLAIIAYSLPLPFFFKYPLAFIFLLLGIGMAFVPVQGRSLDVWLIAFVKSIYSPTQYTWKRTPTIETIETSVPSKENSLSSTPPVSNPRIEVATQTPQPEPITTPQVTSATSAASAELDVSPAPSPAPSSIPSPMTPLVSTPITPSPQPAPVAAPVSAPVEPQPASTPASHAPTINLPIPFTPTSPNTLVGLTLNPSGNILDGVLVEIRKDNLTIRATKSNKLGQFMFARPLDSGLYQILAEKDDFNFVPYSLELTGDIVKPLKIQAQN